MFQQNVFSYNTYKAVDWLGQLCTLKTPQQLTVRATDTKTDSHMHHGDRRKNVSWTKVCHFGKIAPGSILHYNKNNPIHLKIKIIP